MFDRVANINVIGCYSKSWILYAMKYEMREGTFFAMSEHFSIKSMMIDIFIKVNDDIQKASRCVLLALSWRKTSASGL